MAVIYEMEMLMNIYGVEMVTCFVIEHEEMVTCFVMLFHLSLMSLTSSNVIRPYEINK
jgi:hypothetical protein